MPLPDPLKKAYTISVIALYDWPEQWPDLFDHLLAGLKSNQPALVHGVMRVLMGQAVCGIHFQRLKHPLLSALPDFKDVVDNTQLPALLPLCLPELYRITVESRLWDLRTRGRAIRVFSSLLIAAKELSMQANQDFFNSIQELLPQVAWGDTEE